MKNCSRTMEWLSPLESHSSSCPHHSAPMALFPAISSHHRRLLLLPVPSTAPRRRSPILSARSFPKHPQPNPSSSAAIIPAARPWIADNQPPDEDEDEDEDDRSLDLLVRFLHNVFRKASRRARKAVRAVLPPVIPTKLVNFSVDGALVLGFLWVLKAFLEVVCTLGSTVYVSILLIQGIWSGVSYIKENRYYYANRTDDDNVTWNGTQAAI